MNSNGANANDDIDVLAHHLVYKAVTMDADGQLRPFIYVENNADIATATGWSFALRRSPTTGNVEVQYQRCDNPMRPHVSRAFSLLDRKGWIHYQHHFEAILNECMASSVPMELTSPSHHSEWVDEVFGRLFRAGTLKPLRRSDKINPVFYRIT